MTFTTDPTSLFTTGVERGHFFITTDFGTELFRAAALGASPTSRGLLDRATAIIGWIAIPVWRTFIADRAIKKHRKEHAQRLASQAK